MSIEGRSNFREDNFDKKTELDESQSRSGAKVDLNNLIKRVKEDEEYEKLKKKYPNMEMDDYELAMAYKDGYNPWTPAFIPETPSNHFLLLSPK